MQHRNKANRPWSTEHGVVLVQVGQVLVEFGDAAEVLRLDGWSVSHLAGGPTFPPVQQHPVAVDRRPPEPTTTMRLRFDCNSTARRPIDDVRYDRPL